MAQPVYVLGALGLAPGEGVGLWEKSVSCDFG